ncbi:MAG: Phytanoyl-CoA dioxygenase [Candidatus Eremiobacteraeota bacterium]|nr:Phytanoyl-CoA dioxygenase [Candidatus Eremiobacteraeota bacterium]
MQVESRAAAFEAAGYVVIPDFTSPAEIGGLRARAEELVEAFDPRTAGAVFTTRDDAKTKSEQYFFTSGTAVRCFFEEEAFDAAGALRQPKQLSINKIGHALHELDPVFARFSRDPRLCDLAVELGNGDPRVYQSMYIFKQPHIGGEVRWHQDATYFVTEPISVLTFWFALERADRTNGCLWTQRGGHRTPLRERFVVEDGKPHMESLDATPWPYKESAEPIEVDAGTLVVFHGLLPHYSAPNRSSSSRHAYTINDVDGRATYAKTNWLQRGRVD